MTEKLQKVLAAAGVASRRQIEAWIKEGRITVDGNTAMIGDRITTDAKVFVDGREIKLIKSQSKKIRVLLYHKPEGEICSRSDPENRPTVFDRLPLLRNGRWIAVGRLDFNTSGVLLLTSDGDLANKLMHPSAEIEREYAVRIHGEVNSAILNRLKKGVELSDGLAHFEQIIDAGGEGSNHWYHVIVKQGRNRLVRRLWESQDVRVSRLIRVRFGAITLPRDIRRGRWEELDLNGINTIKEMAGYIDSES
jgi:23S rRNA pseudouridine2605 synthase